MGGLLLFSKQIFVALGHKSACFSKFQCAIFENALT